MKTIAILTSKILIFLGNILNRGSSLPGKIALKIDKKLLSKLKYPSIRICVTGSSGKGSTCQIIANVLEYYNYTVCFNESGSNLAWGTTTSFLKDANLFGELKSDVLLMEVDERYTKDIFTYLKPTHIVITNLTKDQVPRQHHIDEVYNDILKSINKESTIITNMDEPYLRNLEKDTNNKIIYYSIAKNQESYHNSLFENLNTYYCPYCKEPLKYDYYNFETLGSYHCSSCSFKYHKPEIIGENLNLDKQTMSINKLKVNIGTDMLYQAYNTICSYALLTTLNLNPKDIIKSINKYNTYKENKYKIKDKIYYPISCKAENATTYNQAVFKVYNNKDKKDIVIGWKEISRRYKHFDISWLYDIEFELLNNNSLNKAYAVGIDKDNIKKRLILASIPEDKIITSDTLEEIKDNILKDEVKIVFGILNFDYMEPFKKVFKEEK